MKLVALGCVLLAGCSGGGAGDDDTLVEICNGLDDTGDGLVDEGCPCKPFDVSLPRFIGGLVPLGSGWVGTSGTYSAPTLSLLGDEGNVSAETQLPDAMHPSQLAWNGDELAYVATTASDTYLAFIRPDGTGFHAGPARGEPMDIGGGAVRWLGGEYHVAYSRRTADRPLPDIMYAVTDGVAGWHDERAANASNAAWLGAITELAGMPIVVWIQHSSPGTGERMLVGPPWEDRQSAGSPSLNTALAQATDGANVLIVNGARELLRYDGAAVTPLIASQPERAAAVTSSGRRWWIVRFTSDPGADLVELGADFAPMTAEPLLPAGMHLIRAELGADARRLLVTLEYSNADQTAGGVVAVQRCL